MVTIQDIVEHEPLMWYALKKVTDNHDLIKDAIQDTYLYFLEREQRSGLDFLHHEKTGVNINYIRMVAVDRFRMIVRGEIRRHAREQIAGHEINEQAMEEVVEELVEDIRNDSYWCAVEVVKAIEELPSYDRNLLKEVYFLKTKQKELSELTGVPYKTLKSDIKNAREKIKREIQSQQYN